MIIVIVVVVVFVVVVVAVVAAVVVTGKPCPGMAVFNYAYNSQLHTTNYHAYNQTVFVSIPLVIYQSFFAYTPLMCIMISLTDPITRSDPKVPGSTAVFQCALDFPEHLYAMRSSDILATHSLENFLLCSFNLEILHRTWDHVSADHWISTKWRPLMNNVSALPSV